MRNLIAMLTALVLMAPLSGWAQQAPAQPQYEEGRHYHALPYPVRTRDASKIEVVELFWYGCPHCYDFEPLVKEWRKGLAEDVDFWYAHALFAPGSNWEPHARTFYTAEILGVEDKIRQPLFDALVKERRKLNDVNSLAEFVGGLGVDAEKFKKTFNSFSVQTKIDQIIARVRSYRATGVPVIVVNGKYRIDPGSAGSLPNMLRIADYLIAKERAQAQN